MLCLTFDDVTLYGNGSDDSVESPPSSQDSHQQRKGTKAVPWAIPCTQDTCRCFDWWERSRAVINKLLTEDAKVSVLAWDIEGLEEYDVSDYYTLSSVDWQKKWIWKVEKDHRRKGYVSIHDDLRTFPSGISYYEDLTDDAEKASEREEWDNDQYKVFLEALVGLEGPTKSVPMSYAPSFPSHMGPASPH